MPGQNTYPFASPPFRLGMLLDMSRVNAEIISCRATSQVGVGTYVEVNFVADGTWTCNAPLGTTTTLGFGGIVCVETVKEPNAANPDTYQIGEIVPVLRKGRICAASFPGMTAPTAFGQTANIMHSSTLAVSRGKLTTVAVSTSAGVEIQASSDKDKIIFLRDLDSVNGLCAVEINSP